MTTPERIWVTGGHYWENPTFKRDKFEYIRADLAITETQPDPRDDVIGALVDAMHTISGDIQINADGEEELSDAARIARAALAAAKAVMG